MDKKQSEKLLKIAKEIIRLYGEESYEQCLEYCEKILVGYPYDFNTLVYKGACLNKLKKYNEAIAALSKGISVVDDQFGVYVFRGDSYYDIGEYEEAADDYKKSIELEPTNGAAFDKYARSLFRIGEVEEALKMVRKAVEIGKSPEPIIIMANMLKRLGLKQEEFKTMSLGASMFLEDKRFDDYRN